MSWPWRPRTRNPWSPRSGRARAAPPPRTGPACGTGGARAWTGARTSPPGVYGLPSAAVWYTRASVSRPTLVDDPDVQPAHRGLPLLAGDRRKMRLAAPCLEELQLREPALVRDAHDPFAVRGPSRQERVVLAEGHLVGLAAGRRQHEEVGELAAEVRGVDEPFSVRRPLRTRPEQRLLLVNQPGTSGCSSRRARPPPARRRPTRAECRGSTPAIARGHRATRPATRCTSSSVKYSRGPPKR